MDIIIRNTGDRPIYEQIREQIRASIQRGEFSAGDLLPSIRALAKDLRISVITTKRAYDELEREGYIHSVAGKGCYVAERSQRLIREEALARIEDKLRELLPLARGLGLAEEELIEMLRTIMREDGQ